MYNYMNTLLSIGIWVCIYIYCSAFVVLLYV